MIQTILVLGATGKTGRRLLPRLVARGLDTRPASRTAAADHVLFDWGDPTTYESSLERADAVYLVPPALVEDPAPAVATLLDRAAALGVKRVVALSSLGVTFPGEPAESGRRRFEQAVTSADVEWTILRPSGFSQNFSEGFLLPGILQAGLVVTATGNGAVPLVDAGDIASVAVEALTGAGHAGAVYPVTGPAALTFAEAARVLSLSVGREIRHHAILAEEMASRMRHVGVPDDYAAMLLRDQKAVRDGFAARTADTVERLCGRPATAFADYVTSEAAALLRSLMHSR